MRARNPFVQRKNGSRIQPSRAILYFLRLTGAACDCKQCARLAKRRIQCRYLRCKNILSLPPGATVQTAEKAHDTERGWFIWAAACLGHRRHKLMQSDVTL